MGVWAQFQTHNDSPSFFSRARKDIKQFLKQLYAVFKYFTYSKKCIEYFLFSSGTTVHTPQHLIKDRTRTEKILSYLSHFGALCPDTLLNYVQNHCFRAFFNQTPFLKRKLTSWVNAVSLDLTDHQSQKEGEKNPSPPAYVWCLHCEVCTVSDAGNWLRKCTRELLYLY